jgi:hypothetical protein
MKRSKTILIVVAVAVCGLAIAVFALGGSKPQTSTESPAPSPTGTPLAVSTDPSKPGHDAGVVEFQQRFPALAKLPLATEYWRLEVAGEIKDNVLPLRAYVPIAKGGDKAAQAAVQKGYIEKYLDSIGQYPGTYGLEIQVTETDGL